MYNNNNTPSANAAISSRSIYILWPETAEKKAAAIAAIGAQCEKSANPLLSSRTSDCIGTLFRTTSERARATSTHFNLSPVKSARVRVTLHRFVYHSVIRESSAGFPARVLQSKPNLVAGAKMKIMVWLFDRERDYEKVTGRNCLFRRSNYRARRVRYDGVSWKLARADGGDCSRGKYKTGIWIFFSKTIVKRPDSCCTRWDDARTCVYIYTDGRWWTVLSLFLQQQRRRWWTFLLVDQNNSWLLESYLLFSIF